MMHSRGRMLRVLLVALGIISIAAHSAAPVAATFHAPDVGIVSATLSADAIVNVTNSIRITLENPSDSSAATTLDIAYADGAPATRPDTVGNRLVIDAHSNTTFTVPFDPPFARRGAQVLVITASTSGDTRASNDSMILAIFVKTPRLGVAFDPVLDPGVVPEGSSFIGFNVTNDGNAPDAPRVTFVVNAPWKAELLSPLGVIRPGTSSRGVILLESGTANATQPLELVLTAASGIRSSISASASAPELVTNLSRLTDAVRAVRVETGALAQIFPGETVRQPLMIKNEGRVSGIWNVSASVIDSTAGWHARVELANGPGARVLNATRDLVPLEPGESRHLVLNVTRNASAVESTAAIMVRAGAVDAALLAPFHAPSALNGSVTTRFVDAGPDLAVVAINAPVDAYFGDTVSFTVSVRNVGRASTATAALRVDVSDRLSAIASTNFSIPALSPGAWSNHSWTLVASDWTGKFVASARATAISDATAENDVALASFTVRNPRITLRGPDRVDVNAGSRLTLATSASGFFVENTGDSTEVVIARLESDQRWLRADWRVSVLPGGRAPLPLNVSVPEFPGARVAEARLTAFVEKRPNIAAARVATFVMNDTAGPTALLVSPREPVDVGGVAEIVVRARDESGVARVDAIVTSPTGLRRTIPLVTAGATELEGESLWRGNAGTLSEGRHSLELRLADTQDPARTRVVGGLSINVTGSRHLGLRPANFEEGRVTAASILQFAEVVRGTVRSAEADSGTGFAPFAFPFELDARSWPDGPHRISVRSIGANGAAWEGTWNISLDRAPPVVSKPAVRMDAEGMLVIDFEARGAMNASARVESAGGVVNVPLSETGDGVYRGRAPAPSAWTRVIVVAVDSAGNTRAETFDREPVARTTSVPALAGVVALLFAALMGAPVKRRGGAPRRGSRYEEHVVPFGGDENIEAPRADPRWADSGPIIELFQRVRGTRGRWTRPHGCPGDDGGGEK